MSCPFLTGERLPSCSAGRTSYVPNEHELRTFCECTATENRCACRRYRQAVWSGLSPTVRTQPPAVGERGIPTREPAPTCSGESLRFLGETTPDKRE